jgi:hypothetical protein
VRGAQLGNGDTDFFYDLFVLQVFAEGEAHTSTHPGLLQQDGVVDAGAELPDGEARPLGHGGAAHLRGKRGLGYQVDTQTPTGTRRRCSPEYDTITADQIISDTPSCGI